MAPQKNQIEVKQELHQDEGVEVKQELQDESRPDRATPSPGPGATRRQRQKKPKKQHRVWRPVKKGSKVARVTSFAPFVRLVKEITESCSSQVKRWTPEALLWLQGAADYYLIETFDDERLLTIFHMRASSSPLGEKPAAGKEQGVEHAGGSPEEAEEKPNGLVKPI